MRMRRDWWTAGLLVCIVSLGASGGARAQQGSGRVVLAFIDALARNDMDAVMTLLVAEPEVQTPEGETIHGSEAVRAYLAALPRPIELGVTLPWGGRKYEAHVTADGASLVFIFDGAEGFIAFIDIRADESIVPGSP